MFRAANFETVDLGVFLPPESFARVVANTDGLVAVGISVTTPDQEDQIEQTLAALTAVTTAPIILGGAGVDEATADRLGVDGWARSASDAIALVETLLAAQR
jgi:methanogenic corrinoid protein MtbC1